MKLSSVSRLEATSRNLASWEIHCKTGPQLSHRCSPSKMAIDIRVLILSIFLCFISLIDPRYVNFAKEFMKVSRASDMWLFAAIRMAYANPFRQTAILRSSVLHSRTCDNVPIKGPQVTSNIGLTTSAGAILSVICTAAAFDSFSAFVIPGRFLNKCSVADIISSRSLRKFAFFRSSALVPKKDAPSNKYEDSITPFVSRSRASSSSLREKGCACIRLKIAVRNSSGKSVPSTEIPRLFRIKESTVIRFSGLILGL
mmetsp:Transcript_13343/g.24118  ORF Transcript_13343/g.24118 Transcript_13343/m.24118 type:complete len:256 (+) Transcript_13343:3976-4743(+)